MCRPISMILSESEHWLPEINQWNHSHSEISKRHGLPDGLYGDKYARVEVSPPGERFRDNDANLIEFSEAWTVRLDESREPGWWSEDPEKHKDRARKYAERWWKAFRDRGAVHLVPGYRAIGGDGATLTGGCGSTLTGGDGSTLIFRYWDENHQRIAVAYVGEDGIEPGVPYKCEGGKVVRADA